jgi:hypothetical protein
MKGIGYLRFTSRTLPATFASDRVTRIARLG